MLRGYGIDVYDLGHRVADLADKILKGRNQVDYSPIGPRRSREGVRKTRIISLSDVSGRAHFFLAAKYGG